ncbi:uncharacterized protein TRIADDRAFT_56182 [Trichoplax adhaerens]|uniref:G-protein coupled receptors family 1 profile domain-containing protein n=1 Tax=Trichoplax adhaerens TaxID=10228 RepID=B3RXE6_TRIAD|nr:hypothetical protein TRIADDRAFT_56182 [Trichoplax adhaerens]EDV24407.1 hypothetical protein TRIADDRAFT_56182 [Trichoplax adhaerens]|eukprot:XP_002112297.1 hypothetical protein TRIADDRAFT_56182 [Trichoplax adhaerens]
MAASAIASYWKINNSGPSFTIRRAWQMVCVAYIAPVLLLLLPTVGLWARITYFHGVGICMIDFSSEIDTNHIVFMFAIVFPILFITTAIIGFCYCRIYRIVRRSSKVIAQYNARNHQMQATTHNAHNCNNTPFEHRKTYSRRDISLAKTLVVIFALFIVSYAPYALANIFYFFNLIDLSFTQALYLLTVSCVNSIFNPIIFYSRRRRLAITDKIFRVKQVDTGVTMAMKQLETVISH